MKVFHSLVIVGILIVLAGCVSRFERLQTDMAARGVAQLTGSEIVAIFKDKTVQGSTSKFQYTRTTAAGGTARGRAWGTWGEEVDNNGKWYVNDQNQYCMEWFGKWANGEHCSIIYPGKSPGHFVEAVISGNKMKAVPDGIYRYRLRD